MWSGELCGAGSQRNSPHEALVLLRQASAIAGELVVTGEPDVFGALAFAGELVDGTPVASEAASDDVVVLELVVVEGAADELAASCVASVWRPGEHAISAIVSTASAEIRIGALRSLPAMRPWCTIRSG